MFHVKQFKRQHHTPMIREWLLAHQMDLTRAAQLPSIGLIVFSKKNEGIAAAFLRRIENCAVALLDGMITNPQMKSEDRNQALDVLTEAIISRAKKLGLKKLIATTHIENIVLRSLRHGFQVLAQTPIGIQLKERN